MNTLRTALLLWLLALCGCAHAGGTITQVLRATELRADKRPQAVVLQNLEAGASVELFSLEGGWAWVAPRAAPDRRGWVRAGVLGTAAVASAATTLQSGRNADTSGTVTLGLRGKNNWHAVLVLAGGPRGEQADLEAMRQVAQALEVPPDQLRVMRGAEVTPANIAAAVTETGRSLGAREGVLLYVSGRGTRVPSPPGSRCAEAILTPAGEGLTGEFFAGLLAPIAQRRHPVLALYDASFTPAPPALQDFGLHTDADESPLRARTQPAAAACAGADAAPFATAAGTPLAGRDQVQFAFATGRIAFDDEAKGGLLTQYFRDCLLRDAQDPAGGAPSAQDMQACIANHTKERLAGAQPLAADAALAGDGTLPLEPLARVGELR